ncbi:hypothetical protein HYQ44_007127 [Verticillium longisporum]|nr:hypothetical protein HYQ44_007127 [Verticillium longisporum]
MRIHDLRTDHESSRPEESRRRTQSPCLVTEQRPRNYNAGFSLVFTFLSFRLRTFKRDPTKPWVFFLRAALVTYSLWTILYTAARGYEIEHLNNRDSDTDWRRNIYLTAPILAQISTWMLLIAQSLLLCTIWELLFTIQIPQAGGRTSRPRFARLAVHCFTALLLILAIAQFGLAVDADRSVYDDATSTPFVVPTQGQGGSNRIAANRMLVAIAALLLIEGSTSEDPP